MRYLLHMTFAAIIAIFAAQYINSNLMRAAHAFTLAAGASVPDTSAAR